MPPRILTATIATVLLSVSAVVIRAEDKPKAEDAAPATPTPAPTKPLSLKVGEVRVIEVGKSSSATPGGRISGSVSVGPAGPNGKAIVTIEVNGKKEVREIEMGNATEIKVEPAEGAKMVRATFIGVSADELPDELGAQLPLEAGTGLIVRAIIPESPAALAGLQRNDVLARIDDQALTSPRQLKNIISGRKPGDIVGVVFFRKGQRNEVQVKLTEREVPEASTDAIKVGPAGTLSGLVPGIIIRSKPVVVDSNGNVIPVKDSDSERNEAIKRIADEVVQARRKADEAARQLQEAGKDASEILKTEVAESKKQFVDALRKLREEVEKSSEKKTEAEPNKAEK
jgi:hypothetical protein